jgi:hypothetical protein
LISQASLAEAISMPDAGHMIHAAGYSLQDAGCKSNAKVGSQNAKRKKAFGKKASDTGVLNVFGYSLTTIHCFDQGEQ